jgi:hypothetical protein
MSNTSATQQQETDNTPIRPFEVNFPEAELTEVRTAFRSLR